jgi:hypothetical protein
MFVQWHEEHKERPARRGGAETGGGAATDRGGEGPARGGGVATGKGGEGGPTEEENRPTALSASGRRCCWKHLEPSSAQWWAWVRNGVLFVHPHLGSAGDGLTVFAIRYAQPAPPRPAPAAPHSPRAAPHTGHLGPAWAMHRPPRHRPGRSLATPLLAPESSSSL